MDRKKVKKATHSEASTTPSGVVDASVLKHPVVPKIWRRLLPYFFMSGVFLLAAIGLELVLFDRLVAAGRVVLVAIVLAGLEYHVYRLSAGPSSMEHEFSSLSDMFCFAVVPGFLIYHLAFRGWGILGLMGLFAIVFAGLIRLSLYKLYHPVSKTRNVIGIPLSINAAFIALVAQLTGPQPLPPLYRLALLFIVMALSFLTVSTIPYPNPADSPGTLILAALLILAVFVGPPVTLYAAGLLLAGGVMYFLLSPFWLAANARSTR